MPPRSATPNSRPTAATQRFLLRDLHWSAYEVLLHELRNQPIRMTYDRGSLELLAPSDAHRSCARLVARLVETLAHTLGMALLAGKPTTFKRCDVGRGLEPDRYYYRGGEIPGHGMRPIQADIDRLPDLAVEIDLEGSAIDRMGAYAALGFPEVWRFDGEDLRIHRLQDDGGYAVGVRSPLFPIPDLSEAFRVLKEGESMDDTSLVPSLPAWIRQQIRLPQGGWTMPEFDD
jgi:Uma2 family endonuclease